MKQRYTIFAAGLLAVLTLLFAPSIQPAHAAVLDVPCGDVTALENAVSDANTTSGLDTVNLNPNDQENCIYNLNDTIAFVDTSTLDGNGAELFPPDSTTTAIVSAAPDNVIRDVAITGGKDAIESEADGLGIFNVTVKEASYGLFSNTDNIDITARNFTIVDSSYGGVYLQGSATVTLNFSSIQGVAQNGVWTADTGAIIYLNSTWVADSGGLDCQIDQGNIIELQPSFDSDNSCPQADTISTATDVADELRDNGGPVETLAIPAGSPLHDATFCDVDDDADGFLETSIYTDSRGVTRPFNSLCDAGAYERWPVDYLINSSADSGDEDLTDGICEMSDGQNDCSLRAAIEQANAQPDENWLTVQSSPSFYPFSPFIITEDLRLNGDGAYIDATNTGTDGIAVQGASAYIDGIVVSNASDDGISIGSGAYLILLNSVLNSNDYGLFDYSNFNGVQLWNVTIADNITDGILGFTDGLIVNSIIWNNGDDLDFYDPGSVSITHSDVEDALPSGLGYSDGNISADPQFTSFYLPQSGSPVINAGDFRYQIDLTDRDEDGIVDELYPLDNTNLPRVDGGIPDMGAREMSSDPLADVPEDLPAPFMEDWVEYYYQTGITSGKVECNDGTTAGPGETVYCPVDNVTRGEMAVFILRAIEYPSLPYNPPGDPNDPFADVPGPDLPAPFMEDWIETFYNIGITSGKYECNDGTTAGPGELLYCPADNVTRAEMAVFILRALEYPNLPYSPPDDPSDPFVDVPSDLPAPFMEEWVEEFYARGITTGKVECNDGTTAGPGELLYCPEDNVTRAEMAVFILRAFDQVPDPND